MSNQGPADKTGTTATGTGEGKTGKPLEQKAHVPGEGIRQLKTSNVFRAINFELYAKPSKPIMIFGVACFSIAVGYLAYMRMTYSRDEYYEAFNEDGSVILRPRKSRWDS